MALQHGQFQVRDLVMGPGTVYDILAETNPFSRQVRSDQSGKRAWNHGSWSGAEWSEEVVVPLRVLIDTDDETAWLAAHQKLVAAFRPVGESIADVEMRFALGGSEFVMFGRPRMVEPETTLIGLGKAFTQCAFVALDPFIYSASKSAYSGIGLPQFSDGLTIPGSPVINGNTGFESDTSGWFAFRATVSRSTAEAYQGVASGLVTPDGSGDADVGQSDVAGVTPDVPYDWSSWLFPNTAAMFSMVLQYKDSGGVTVADREFEQQSLPTSRWSRLPVVDVAPSGAATVTPKIRIKSPAVGDTFYVDAARLRRADGGLSAPFSIAGVLSDSEVELTNAGTADTPLLVTLHGPAEQPRIILQLADGNVETLRFDLTVLRGQYLEVDTKSRTVMLNGTTNRRGQVIGDFPMLPQGTHTLRWFASNYDPAAEMTVTYRDAWW